MLSHREVGVGAAAMQEEEEEEEESPLSFRRSLAFETFKEMFSS